MSEFTPSLRRAILNFMQRPGYEPLRQRDLAAALGLPRAVIRQALRALEQEGLVVRWRKNRWGPPRGAPWVAGRLRVHADGYGFVRPDEAGQPDVFIPPESLGPALDGDRVIVSLDTRQRSGAGPSGRVLRVLERRHERIVGRFRRTSYYDYVIPESPRIQENIRIRSGGHAALEDHLVVVELDPRDKAGVALTGTVVEDLGPADAAGADMLAVLRSYDLRMEFPRDAQRQALSAESEPSPALLENREDLREAVVFTIDPEDAHDFDDAISITRAHDGALELGVHIADVSFFVPQDSPVDKEARRRGTSVYLADRVVPMLPPYLTTQVCSLQPGRTRLTQSVFLRFTPQGELLGGRTAPSVIRSAARLNYKQVQAYFLGQPAEDIPAAVRESLNVMRELAAALRRKRMAEGSLDLAIPEVRCILREDGSVQEIEKRESNEAYQLIEEFMLAANRWVASRIAAAGYPSLYRIHEEPDPEQWQRMELELRTLGLGAALANPANLSRTIAEIRRSPVSHAAQMAILRNLKRALYAPEPGLHFGLAFHCYTHFTSPIRRYPDLVVHRVLKAVESGGPPPYTSEDTVRLAAHCSDTEWQAAEAEQESVERKRIQYFQDQLRRGEIGPYAAVICGVNKRGLTVELVDSLQRGHVATSALPADLYELDEDRTRLWGRRRRLCWKVGQSLDVLLSRVDLRRRTVSLLLAPPERPRRKRRQRIM